MCVGVGGGGGGDEQVGLAAWRDAIMRNASVFDGKVVLDVGCGVGILSMLAARAGASKVIALETNPEVCRQARAVVADNGLGDVITVVHGDVSSAELPVKQVCLRCGVRCVFGLGCVCVSR